MQDRVEPGSVAEVTSPVPGRTTPRCPAAGARPSRARATARRSGWPARRTGASTWYCRLSSRAAFWAASNAASEPRRRRRPASPRPRPSSPWPARRRALWRGLRRAWPPCVRPPARPGVEQLGPVGGELGEDRVAGAADALQVGEPFGELVGVWWRTARTPTRPSTRWSGRPTGPAAQVVLAGGIGPRRPQLAGGPLLGQHGGVEVGLRPRVDLRGPPSAPRVRRRAPAGR